MQQFSTMFEQNTLCHKFQMDSLKTVNKKVICSLTATIFNLIPISYRNSHKARFIIDVLTQNSHGRQQCD